MKSGSVRPGIVRVYKGNDCHSSSAVMFKGKLAISPVNFLTDLHAVVQLLGQDQPIVLYDDHLASNYHEIKCTIVPAGGDRELPAKLKFLFHSHAIRGAFERILRKSPSIKLSKDDTLSVDERTLLLSSFFVFEFMDNVEGTKYKESHEAPMKGGDFTVIATPYGNAIMQGSAFQCRVANVINEVLFLIDQPLSRGCEGGILLSPHSDPLGMILTTTFESKNENLNLTFAGDLWEILKGLPTTGKGPVDDLHSWTLPTDPAEKFVVLIESGQQSYGTGTLIQIGNRRLILTCSHVVTDNKSNYCTWNGRKFPISLIYKNPFFDRPFDVAVFVAPREVPSTAFCRSANSNPVVGE